MGEAHFLNSTRRQSDCSSTPLGKGGGGFHSQSLQFFLFASPSSSLIHDNMGMLGITLENHERKKAFGGDKVSRGTNVEQTWMKPPPRKETSASFILAQVHLSPYFLNITKSTEWTELPALCKGLPHFFRPVQPPTPPTPPLPLFPPSGALVGPPANDRRWRTCLPATFPLLTAALYKAACVLKESSGVCLTACMHLLRVCVIAPYRGVIST